jgi:hypothetical protein
MAGWEAPTGFDQAELQGRLKELVDTMMAWVRGERSTGLDFHAMSDGSPASRMAAYSRSAEADAAEVAKLSSAIVALSSLQRA